MRIHFLSALCLAVIPFSASAWAVTPDGQAAARPERPSVQSLERMIDTRSPQTRIDNPSHDRISARRIDIVDENGTVRMVLAAPTPNPIIDGIQYRRAFDVAGVTIYDAKGSERGGFGVADVDGGMAVVALDYPNTDAIGWRVMPDGAVRFMINDRPEQIREPALGGRLIPGVKNATRISLDVAADGKPSINLADEADRPRLRLTVTPEGYGAIEFLNAKGEIVQTLAPERDLAASRE